MTRKPRRSPRIIRVTVGCGRRWRAAVISDEGARLGAEAAHHLAQTGLCEFETGLTEAEFTRIEREYGFEFTDDHRAFLAAGLPINVPPEDGQTWSRPWPEWRGGDLDSLRRQLDGPVEGVLLVEWANGRPFIRVRRCAGVHGTASPVGSGAGGP